MGEHMVQCISLPWCGAVMGLSWLVFVGFRGVLFFSSAAFLWGQLACVWVPFVAILAHDLPAHQPRGIAHDLPAHQPRGERRELL